MPVSDSSLVSILMCIYWCHLAVLHLCTLSWKQIGALDRKTPLRLQGGTLVPLPPESHHVVSVPLVCWYLAVLRPIRGWWSETCQESEWFPWPSTALRKEKKYLSSEGKLWKLNGKYYQDWEREQKKQKNKKHWEQPAEANRTFIWVKEGASFFLTPTLGFSAE